MVRVILLFYLMPAWAVLLAWRILGERPTPSALLRLALAFAGVVLVLLPELGRDFAEYRMLLFGTAMILIMIWRPGGILSQRQPTLRHRAQAGAAP